MDLSKHSTDQFMHFAEIHQGRVPTKLLFTQLEFSAILIHNKAINGIFHVSYEPFRRFC
jgi:hypothetical protein